MSELSQQPHLQASARPPLLLSVQALRGFAAFLVVMFHLATFSITLDDGASRSLFGDTMLWKHGFVGVDAFFVISGFVMVYITQSFTRSPRSVGKFLYSRFTRIYPVWWVFAALAVLYTFASERQFVDADIAPLIASQSSYLVKSFLLIPQSAPIVLEVGWTLVYEMYFYIMFAGLLCLSRHHWVSSLLLWTLAICIVALFFAAPSKPTSLATLMASPLTLEFLMGAGVGLLVISKVKKHAHVIGIFGLILFAYFLCVDAEFLTAQPVWGKIVLFGAPTAMMIYGSVNAEITGRLTVPSWASTFGDWSYSLYLSHLFVLAALGKIFGKLAALLPEDISLFFDLGHASNLGLYTYVAVAIFSCILCAALCYRFIEKPMIRYSKRLKVFKSPRLKQPTKEPMQT